MKTLALVLLLLIAAPVAFTQKVSVGFDRSVDFARYRTFSWPKVDDGNEMTIRKAAVMGEIEYALKSKGLTPIDEGGDLILSGSGGFGGKAGGETQGSALLPTMSSSIYPTGAMWTGTGGGGVSSEIKGTLTLQMVERTTGKLVWQGSVTQRIDMDNKEKSMNKIKAAIAKLLEQYPPKK